MSEFKEYKRKAKALLRPVTNEDILCFNTTGALLTPTTVISIASVDKIAGSPKIGDMIAKNPKDENDQWLIARSYFLDNFEVE